MRSLFGVTRSAVHTLNYNLASRTMGNCLSSTSRSSGSRRIATSATSALPPTELILNYWLGGDGAQFRQLWDPCTTPSNQSKWFGKSDETDMEIKTMFGAEVDRLPEIIAAVSSPSGTVDDTVAAIILGDQMSRNIYRGSKRMYGWDSLVLPLAKSLLADEDAFMARLPLTFKLFTLLPLMHSEEVGDQRACVAWVERVREAVPEGEEGKAAAEFLVGMTKYAKSHCEIVERWGRFPHRNEILGRESTEAEARGLADGTIVGF